MDTYPLFVQSLAIVALGVFALSFHFKSRGSILLVQIASLFVWSTHFALLGAWTGAILSAVNIIVTILFLYKDRKRWIRNNAFLGCTLAVLAIVSIATWEGYFTLFAFLAISSITIAKWQDDPRKIRMISIVASALWIVYDSFVGSYGGIVSESVIIVSILASLRPTRKHSA
jgi:hypothetical protein